MFNSIEFIWSVINGIILLWGYGDLISRPVSKKDYFEIFFILLISPILGFIVGMIIMQIAAFFLPIIISILHLFGLTLQFSNGSDEGIENTLMIIATCGILLLAIFEKTTSSSDKSLK